MSKRAAQNSCFLAVALISILVDPQRCASKPLITNIRQARRSQVVASIPVRLRGIVTGFSGWNNSFFLQDTTDAISVDRLEATPVSIGDEVEVSGRLRPGLFAPILLSDHVRVNRHAGLPGARRADYDELARATLDSRLVEVRGTVHAVARSSIWKREVLFLDLGTPGGIITVHVLNYPERDPSFLVDSDVRITGVCGTIFNDRRQLVGLRLFVSDLSRITVVNPAVEIKKIPASPLKNLLRFDGPSQDHRIKVEGTVTYQASDRDFYLQDGNSAIRVQSLTRGNWKSGLRVSASGFLFSSGYLPALRQAIVEPENLDTPVEPIEIKAEDAIRAESGFTQAPFNGLLIQITGTVLEASPLGGGEVWVLRSGDTTFQAQLPAATYQKRLVMEPGTSVSLTGICLVQEDDNRNIGSFRVLLRSPGDIRPLNTPYWSSSLLLLLSITVLILFGSTCLWLMHRRAFDFSNEPVSSRLQRRFATVSQVAAALAMCVGLAVLISWVFDIPLLRLTVGGVPVTPNTGAGILVAGMGVWCAHGKKQPFRVIQYACASVCLMVGGLTILEYVAPCDLHIDQIFVANPGNVPINLDPGRMSIASALCLALLGLAMLLTGRRKSAGLGQVSAIAAAVIGLLNLITYLYGTQSRYGAGAHATMTLPTAACVFGLSLAILFLRSDWGLVRTVLLKGSGGVMTRRMIPVAVGAPIFIGWLRLQGQIAGLYDTRFGLSLFALATIVCFGFVIWSSASVLNQLDAQRSRAEQSLREREYQLETVFRTAGIGDWTWNTVTDRVKAHPVFWKLYGAPEMDSAPAAWFQARQHPEDNRNIAGALSAAVAAGKPFEMEFRVVHPNGAVRWLCCRGIPICGPSGELLQTSGIGFDVTDRKVAETRLRESEKRFQQLAEAMPQIVWAATANGEINYFNQRWYEFTATGRTVGWQQSVHPDDLSFCVDLFLQCVREERPYEAEVRLKGSDGRYRWHLARAVPVTDSSGAVAGWFGTSTDIDDFKRASAELQRLNASLDSLVRDRSAKLAESEQQYKLLLDGVEDYAIIMLNGFGTVIRWNSGAERILGYSAEEILGRHFSAFYEEQDNLRNHWQDELALAKETGHFEEEGRRLKKNGAIFWARVTVTPLFDEHGRLQGFSKVIQDISERKSAEALARKRSTQLSETNSELIRQRQRAEDASRAKSNFLATMSHEIRTPMNAILGMADLLWETHLTEIQRDYVGRFRRAGGSLLALINDILDLSKIESGHFELEKIAFDLHEVVDRTTELLEPRARTKNVSLITTVSPGTPRGVIGDAVRLQQILNNLLGNAIKFTEKGSIRLTVCGHSDNLPGHLQVEVSDTGIGIPPDKIAVIFDDFTQAESSTTRRFGGTGLGLGICRRLINHMGGELNARSVFGEGSTFSFDFFVSIAESVYAEQPLEMADLTGSKVLIVDDNSDNRLILSQMCNGWGMIAREHANLSDARQDLSEALARGEAFSLALLDSVMPDNSALEALDVLLRISPDLPVILVSSDPKPGEVTRSKAIGAAGYISKPVRSAELLALISKVVRERKQKQNAGERADQVRQRCSPNALKVLIADDSEDNRFLLSAYLQNLPYTLTFATNGLEAVSRFKQQSFDLVLMDVQMPVMDGLAAVAAIRDFERTAVRGATPIVALTANALAEDQQRSRAAGCDGHLSKPVSKERLLHTIESATRSREFPTVALEGAPEKPQRNTIEVPEGLEELSRQYITGRGQELPRMMRLAKEGELDELRVFGHNMKGTGAPYGFPELTQLGSAIEKAAKESNSSKVIESLDEVSQYVEYALAELS